MIVNAIAHVRSPYARRIDAPHQSTIVAGTETGMEAEALVEFVPEFPVPPLGSAGFIRTAHLGLLSQ